MKLSSAFHCLFLLSTGCVMAAANPAKIWYRQPAAAWDQALPLGNGRLGAMVFGDPHRERIQLNEESLWAGEPVEAWPANFAAHIEEVRRLIFAGKRLEASEYGLAHLTASPTAYRSFEPLGDIWLESITAPAFSDYRRELDLADGIARTTWREGNATFRREVFVTAPDDVVVVRLTTNRPNALGFSVRLTRHKDARVTAGPGPALRLDGQIIDVAAADGGYDDNPGGSGPGGPHMRFAGRLVVRLEGGAVEPRPGEGSLRIRNATTAEILFTAQTDYDLARLNFDRSIDPAAEVERTLRRATAKTWVALHDAHVAEHRARFDRMSLDLTGSADAAAELPTDARRAAVVAGGDDPGLVAHLVQYGRYLLMASSRAPGRLPANLQGIWSELPWAPWEADYHLNINLQMNYWPARVASLPETAGPLLDWFERVARRGRESAERLYGSDGWVAFLASTPFGRVTPSGSFARSQFENSSIDPLCGAWVVAEMFDHWQFTGDRAFLTRLWPLLEGASEFVLDTLVAAPDGTLVICPSTSPENTYFDPATRKKIRITHGSTYHMTVVRALFEATTRATAHLGTGHELRRRIAAASARLPPYRVGSDGRLLEWIEPYREAEPGHRHMSHLLGLYPFDQITSRDPVLFAAARKAIDARLAHGGGVAAWSRAWLVNLAARLRDGEAARAHALVFIRGNTLPNLFSGPLFQVDGNFGLTAGVCEMLVQSHERLPGRDGEFIIDVLPALPRAWPNGKVTGLGARGGVTVSLEWQDSKPLAITVHSAHGGRVHLRWAGSIETVELQPGESRTVRPR